MTAEPAGRTRRWDLWAARLLDADDSVDEATHAARRRPSAAELRQYNQRRLGELDWLLTHDLAEPPPPPHPPQDHRPQQQQRPKAAAELLLATAPPPELDVLTRLHGLKQSCDGLLAARGDRERLLAEAALLCKDHRLDSDSAAPGPCDDRGLRDPEPAAPEGPAARPTLASVHHGTIDALTAFAGGSAAGELAHAAALRTLTADSEVRPCVTLQDSTGTAPLAASLEPASSEAVSCWQRLPCRGPEPSAVTIE